MKNFIKTWWHCLIRTLNKEPHRMCNTTIRSKPKRHFCSCGYLNDGVSFDDYMKLPLTELLNERFHK